MQTEKEVRYRVDDKQIEKVIQLTEPYKPKQEMLDITFGKYGFKSLEKLGYICRVRKKHNKITMEIKKRVNKNEWLEQEIIIPSLNMGVNFFSMLGLTPYMYLKRFREVRTYKDIKIFIDEVDVLGRFIEIEYQESTNANLVVKQFLEKSCIADNPQALYGDIIKDRLQNDEAFKEKYLNGLQETIKYV